MSNNNKPLSLTDKQLIHRLVNEYEYNQQETADIVGCSQSSVARTLSTPIESINEQVAMVEAIPLSSGCYRAAYSDSDHHLTLYNQSIDPYYDPVLSELLADDDI